jgi:tRNA modification GTPase
MRPGDTIAAVSTPPGEGAVALIRISGPSAMEILGRIFEPASAPRSAGVPSNTGRMPMPRSPAKLPVLGVPPASSVPATHAPQVLPRRATFGRITENGALVDEVLVTFFPGPASYTGENLVEVGCHGGILLSAHILELVLRSGARAAEPGEFTQRAFLNGKLDLTRAEAVMDLIGARTPLALRSAAEQLRGRIGEEADALRSAILDTVAHLEAWIDFPEDGIAPAEGAALLEKISCVSARISRLLATAESGRILREGVRVTIVGRPNAGKSSLLNRLLGMERAIVSPFPGTTRDTIEESACLRGILFRLTDTAGIRETTDPVEREGVGRARDAISRADLVLHVFDASSEFHEPPLGEREILIANKSDLPPAGARLPANALRVSSLTGEGFPELVEAMFRETCGCHLAAGDSPAAVNARHKNLLESAAASLAAATALLQAAAPPEIAAIELRDALEKIGAITGSASTEEILGEIFTRFCIGK